MICALVGNLMDLYLERRLAPFQARWIESHVSSCRHCAAAMADWRRLFASLRAVPGAAAPEGLKAAIKAAAIGAAVTGLREAPASLEWREQAPPLALAFSLLALLAALSAFGRGIPSQSCSDISPAPCPVVPSPKGDLP